MMVHQQGLYERYYAEKGVPDPRESAMALGAVIHGAMLSFALSGNREEMRLVREKAIERML
jgi:hypothetical protein